MRSLTLQLKQRHQNSKMNRWIRVEYETICRIELLLINFKVDCFVHHKSNYLKKVGWMSQFSFRTIVSFLSGWLSVWRVGVFLKSFLAKIVEKWMRNRFLFDIRPLRSICFIIIQPNGLDGDDIFIRAWTSFEMVG